MIIDNKIKLYCPLCNFRLLDSSILIRSELKADKDVDEKWRPDYYIKCPRCKNQIAIRKLS